MTLDVSRRSLLTLGAGLGASLIGGNAFARAPKLGTQSPYFYRFNLGSAEVTVVSDGPLPLGDSSGTFIDAAGKPHHLGRDEIQMEPLAKWHEYPVEWRLRVPSLGIDLKCKAVLQDQELKGRTRYWEGAVDYSGTHSGLGYLEMTGYDKPVRLWGGAEK